MKRVVFALFALFVITAGTLIVFHGRARWSSTEGEVRQASLPQQSPPKFTRSPADSHLTLEVLRERVLGSYRLRPDSRLMLAVTDVRRLAGLPESLVTAQFASGHWTVRCGTQEVGTLSELPTFPEMLEFLTEWARRQAWTEGWSDHTGPERRELEDALGRLDALGALRESDRAWAAGSRDATLFRYATRAYALLALGTPDRVGTADPIAARALATLSFARALGSEDPRREASLVAEILGYTMAARELARDLPKSDPVAFFVNGEDAKLERAAAAAVEPEGAHPTRATVAAKRPTAKASAKQPTAKAAAKQPTAQQPTAQQPTATQPTATQTPDTAKTSAVSGAKSSELPVRKAASVLASNSPAKPQARPRLVRLEAPFLHLVRVAARSDYKAWSDLLPRFNRPGVPLAMVLGTGLRMDDVETHAPIAERLLRAMTVHSSARKPGTRSATAVATRASFGQQITRFEAAVGGGPEPNRSVFLRSDLVRAHRQGLLYSALDCVGLHQMDSLAPNEASRWFALGAGSGRAGRRTAAFHRWYAHLADATLGRANVLQLRADVDSLAASPPQALRSYEALRAHLPTGDPLLRGAVRGLVRRMDSRPLHRVHLAAVVQRHLGARSLSERLGASAAADLGPSHPSVIAWRAEGWEDADSLRSLLAKRISDPGQRRVLLGLLARSSDLPDSLVRSAFNREVALQPTSWEVAERYAGWLVERREYPVARYILERWLARAKGVAASEPDTMAARTQLARVHQLEGHPQLALQVLGDLNRSERFPAMERTALVLQDLGKPNQALAIAWAAHRRAPRNAATRGLLAELFWRQGRHDQAAAVLRDGRSMLSTADWRRQVAPRFVACFGTQPAEGLKAAEALMRAGFDDQATLGTIPTALGAQGLHELAFELQSRVKASGPLQVETSILAYGHLKQAKGEDAALGWIRNRFHGNERHLLARFAHQEGYPELLWSMAPERLQGENGDYVWLLRAAACNAAGSSHPRYAETVRHLGGTGGSYHLEIARYLLGLREESEVVSMAASLEQRCEVFYFVGFKDEHRGRRHEAAEWYLMSVESDPIPGVTNRFETSWALQRLMDRTGAGPGRGPAAPGPPPPA